MRSKGLQRLWTDSQKTSPEGPLPSSQEVHQSLCTDLAQSLHEQHNHPHMSTHRLIGIQHVPAFARMRTAAHMGAGVIDINLLS